MKTYSKQDFHNPEQLTRQQVGENYRLLLHEELDGRFRFEGETRAQYFSVSEASWHGCIDGASLSMVYRVPIATPLPDGTVLSSNECCWSDQPRKKRVYCAGPMSSNPEDYNFPAFYSAAESLEKQGYEPVNPADLDRIAGFPLERIKQLDPAEFQEFLKGAAKRDLDALQQCDAIALLPGWESSKGARAEKAVAEWLGLKTYTISPDSEGKWWLVIAEDVERINIKQPDADGWIPHAPGDPMPCAAELMVDVKFRNETTYGSPKLASQFDWGWGGKYYAITAWRPAQHKQPYNSDERAEWGVDLVKEALENCSHTYTSMYDDVGRNPVATHASDDPKGAAGALKTPMWLLPAHALQQTAWIHKLGSEKYGPYNWRKTSVCATTYISAIMRHLDAWRDGEDNDPESGISHIAHVAASCNILLDAQHCGKLNDDRAKLCQI